MLTGAQLDGLTQRFRGHLETISTRTSNAVGQAWDGLPDYEEHRLHEFARRVQPVTRAAKVAAVALGAGYYSTVAQQRPAGVAASLIPLEFDARAAFVAYWNALSNGRPWPEAVAAGRNRAASTASGLVVSSSRRTGDHVLPRADWTRVAAGNACEFCQEAASSTYRSAETADFGHERCSCSVVPV